MFQTVLCGFQKQANRNTKRHIFFKNYYNICINTSIIPRFVMGTMHVREKNKKNSQRQLY